MIPGVLIPAGSLCYVVFLLSYFCGLAQGLTAAQWRSQSIYQVVTDRFARTDASTTASCDLSTYCGGTWKGLINQLDYIQNMGFTAVSGSITRQVTMEARITYSRFFRFG